MRRGVLLRDNPDQARDDAQSVRNSGPRADLHGRLSQMDREKVNYIISLNRYRPLSPP